MGIKKKLKEVERETGILLLLSDFNEYSASEIYHQLLKKDYSKIINYTQIINDIDNQTFSSCSFFPTDLWGLFKGLKNDQEHPPTRLRNSYYEILNRLTSEKILTKRLITKNDVRYHINSEKISDILYKICDELMFLFEKMEKEE